MMNAHLFFLKLFGCMLCEAKANGHEVPIDIAQFSQAIMTGRAHLEVYLQFGKWDDSVGRSDLHCWTVQNGSVLAAWLYELDTIAISVFFAQAERWEHRIDLWHPNSKTSSKRFQIADFMYARRAAKDSTLWSPRVAGRFIAKARVKKPLPSRLVHLVARALASVHHGLAPSHSSRRTPEHTRGEDSSCKPCS
jgi:hypothetical protein